MDRNSGGAFARPLAAWSLSARRAWIEISGVDFAEDWLKSLSARRAWIEMQNQKAASNRYNVALRKESVDRNNRRLGAVHNAKIVALRKESVDRNNAMQIVVVIVHGRSPQGERG